jgi:hypothetical protein
MPHAAEARLDRRASGEARPEFRRRSAIRRLVDLGSGGRLYVSPLRAKLRSERRIAEVDFASPDGLTEPKKSTEV